MLEIRRAIRTLPSSRRSISALMLVKWLWCGHQNSCSETFFSRQIVRDEPRRMVEGSSGRTKLCHYIVSKQRNFLLWNNVSIPMYLVTSLYFQFIWWRRLHSLWHLCGNLLFSLCAFGGDTACCLRVGMVGAYYVCVGCKTEKFTLPVLTLTLLVRVTVLVR